MTPTATAISSLLLSLGLATCGWRFFSAFKKGVSSATEGSIGKLLTSLFFLSAAYNGIVGLGSLFLIINPSGAFWTLAASHLTLTALTFVSVYTVYYIFWPETSPRTLLGTIVLAGGVGLFYINTPLQLTPLLINRGGMGLAVLTGALLLVSLASILYLFTQLFKKTELRSIKILSLAVCGLTIASAVNVTVQALALYWPLSGISTTIVGVLLGIVSLVLLLGMIYAEHGGAFSKTSENKWLPSLQELRTQGFFSRYIKSYESKGALILFSFFLLWWISLYIKNSGNVEPIGYTLWTDLYLVIILWGVWFGFRLSQKNGGLKSTLGTAIACFTAGLYLQAVGGVVYGFYVNWLGVSVPYPSIADFGWIGSVIFYAAGSIFLIKHSKVVSTLGLTRSATQLLGMGAAIFLAFWIPLILAGYSIHAQGLLMFLLDLSFAAAGSIYLSGAILAFQGSTRSSDATASRYCKSTAIALAIHLITDFNFIYRNAKGTWIDGDYGDLLLLASYAVMAYVLSKQIDHTSAKVLEEKSEVFGIERSEIYRYPVYQKALNLFSLIKKLESSAFNRYRIGISRHENIKGSRSVEL